MMIPTLRFIALGLMAFLCTAFSFGCAQAPSTSPNILFILVDQQRQDGVGAYGLEGIQTPHLDQLAREGVRFNHAYTAQPVCAPNRGSMFSGLYPFNHGVRENTWDLDTNIELLPDRLRDAGYATGYLGKWHLGDASRDAFDHSPIYLNDGRGRGHYFPQGDSVAYQTDVLAHDAIAFMKAHQDQPFFLTVSMYPPHPPYSVPAHYEAMYQDLFPNDEQRRKYYAMGTAVDDAVGRLLDALDSLSISENTLVVYTTEHGHYFEHRWNDHAKRLCYETTANVPLLMRFPGTIPSGQVSDLLFNAADLSPTLLGLAGHPTWPKRDGLDLSTQILEGSRDGPAYTSFINVPYIDKSGAPHQPMLDAGEERCVASQEWKLILSNTREPELFHHGNDPNEQSNLWDDEQAAEQKAAMLQALMNWQHRVGDPLSLEELIR